MCSSGVVKQNKLYFTSANRSQNVNHVSIYKTFQLVFHNLYNKVRGTYNHICGMVHI